MSLLAFPLSSQKMNEDIDNRKEHDFTEDDEYDTIMKIFPLQKMWCEKRNNSIYHQFTHAHDCCQYGAMKESRVPL